MTLSLSPWMESLIALIDGDSLVSLRKRLDIGVDTVTRHVRDLEGAELVTVEKSGRCLVIKVTGKGEVVRFGLCVIKEAV